MGNVIYVIKENYEFEACTPCLLCGDGIPISIHDSTSPRICNSCKELWQKIKEKESKNG